MYVRLCTHSEVSMICTITFNVFDSYTHTRYMRVPCNWTSLCFVDSVSDCKKEVVKQVKLTDFTYVLSLFTCSRWLSVHTEWRVKQNYFFKLHIYIKLYCIGQRLASKTERKHTRNKNYKPKSRSAQLPGAALAPLPPSVVGLSPSSVRARRLRPALACPTARVSHAAGQTDSRSAERMKTKCVNFRWHAPQIGYHSNVPWSSLGIGVAVQASSWP